MTMHSAPQASNPTTLAAPARAESGASSRYTPDPTMPLTPMATQSSSVSRRSGVGAGAPAASAPLLPGEVIEVLRDRQLGGQVHVLEPQVVALALALRLLADAEQLPGDADVLAHPGQVESHLVQVPGRRVTPSEVHPAHRQVALVFLERAPLRLVANKDLHGDEWRSAPPGAAR